MNFYILNDNTFSRIFQVFFEIFLKLKEAMFPTPPAAFSIQIYPNFMRAKSQNGGNSRSRKTEPTLEEKMPEKPCRTCGKPIRYDPSKLGAHSELL